MSGAELPRIRYVDIHAHAYRRPVPFVTQFCSPEELKIRYREEGIEMGAILPIVSPEIYFPQANEDILDMVADAPGIFFPFCNLDPRVLTNRADAKLDTVLNYYKELGCKGVGEVMCNMRMDDPLLQNLFRHCEAVGLPVTCDGSDRAEGDFGLYDEPGLPLLERTMKRFPDLKIIGHGPIVWSEYTEILRPGHRKPEFHPDGIQTACFKPQGKIRCEGVLQPLLRDYPNLVLELSDGCGQLMRDPEYAVKFLTEFQDKVMFGTDICFFRHPFKLKAFLDELYQTGKLAPQVYVKIVRNNAIRYFGLPLEETVIP